MLTEHTLSVKQKLRIDSEAVFIYNFTNELLQGWG
jgi:hypothetical protein